MVSARLSHADKLDKAHLCTSEVSGLGFKGLLDSTEVSIAQSFLNRLQDKGSQVILPFYINTFSSSHIMSVR